MANVADGLTLERRLDSEILKELFMGL